MATADATVSPSEAPSESVFWSWLTTVDHKRIGILYGVTAFSFFLIGGLEALLIRAQIMRPGQELIGADTYNAMFTMHATTMIFLVIMPLGAAFFNYLIPLMIGARDVAFPRLNALSYWVFLFGAIFINLGFLPASTPRRTVAGSATRRSPCASTRPDPTSTSGCSACRSWVRPR